MSLPFWCVIAEQQRPDPMAAALRITPSDDDKLFPIEALDLEQSAPVGLIPAIDAFRDDAFNAVFAGQPVEGWAMTDLVIIISQRVRRTIQQRCQPGLAVHQRQRGQVLAVQVQQVEEEEDQRSLTVSVAFWMRLNAVVPSGRTPQSSPSR
jgi:hypothetical protein